MEFRTKVDIANAGYNINHNSTILLFGSCFVDNIGRILERNKFRCLVNPYGVLYNPMSVCKAITEIIENRTYVPDDIFSYGGLFHSFMHHTSFSGTDKDEVLHNINASIARANSFLGSADVIIITLGTSFIYEYDGNIVSNCHKLSEKNFSRKMYSPDIFVGAYKTLMQRLISINPDIRVIFTISPIRHLRDSLHGNMLSKSVLALFVNEIQNLFARNVTYFPAYEIMTDELRDYRFYADDMVHPSDLAVRYIWECFSEMFFDKETTRIIDRCDKVAKMMSHKPFDIHSEQYYNFICKVEEEIKKLVAEVPVLDFGNELKTIDSLKKEI